MKVSNTIVPQKLSIQFKSKHTEKFSNFQGQSSGLASSKVSLVSSAYAIPQISFGKKDCDKLIERILSQDPISVNARPEEFRNLLVKLNFEVKSIHGDHWKCKHEGILRPIIFASNGHGAVQVDAISDLKDYLQANKITALI